MAVFRSCAALPQFEVMLCKNGITRSLALRHALLTVGNFWPHGPISKRIEFGLGGVRAGCGIDRFDRRGQSSAVLPTGVVQATQRMKSGETSVPYCSSRNPWISRTVMPWAYMATILSSKPVKRRSCLGITVRSCRRGHTAPRYGSDCGFNRSMQQIDGTAGRVCQSLASYADAR